jgi:hypothetical protein
MIYDTLILNIKNIRDNEILFDLTNVTLPALVNNTFYSFILPYQPFESVYIEFDNTYNGMTFQGITIKNFIRQNNITTILIPRGNTQFDMYYYNSGDNTLVSVVAPITDFISIDNKKYIWCLVLYNYNNANFNNPMKIPSLFTTNFPLSTTTLKNTFPIILSVTYEDAQSRYKINNLDTTSDILNGFTFFFNQPVKVFGLYAYILKVVLDGNYYIYLRRPMPYSSAYDQKVTNMIISPSNINEVDLYWNYNRSYKSCIKKRSINFY